MLIGRRGFFVGLGALIAAPFVVRYLGEPPAQVAAPGQRFVHGGRMVTGFVIVPDSAPPLKEAPSLPASTFAAIVTRVPMETEWGPFIADITSRAPIASDDWGQNAHPTHVISAMITTSPIAASGPR